MTFRSLMQARAARDKLVRIAVSDIARFRSDANAVVDRLCSAEGDYRAEITNLQMQAFERWDGEGFPDWSYLGELGDTIEYIARTEREEVAALLKR